MMDLLPIHVTMALLGCLCGCVLGLTARLGRFCTFGAIEDHQVGQNGTRLRSWALAIVVALIGTQSLQGAGYIDLSSTPYLFPLMPVLSLVIGGLCFGFGMALVGTCAFGTLVRFASGDLKSLVSLLVLGTVAYMTMRGLSGMVRYYYMDTVVVHFDNPGDQALPVILSSVLPEGTALPVTLIAIIGTLLFWCFKDREFRTTPRPLITGTIIGLAVTAGWFITGYLGNDAFDPQPVQSLGFVRPTGDGLQYLMTFSGASITFGIGSVAGVLIGGFIGALIKKQARWEGFDDVREMKRHLIGAALMGFGGITMLGCTVGQGITGLSSLSAGSFIAVICLYLGATLGLHYVLEGSFREAFTAIRYRFFPTDD